MEKNTKTTVTLVADDKETIEVGDLLIFQVDNKICIGHFQGIAKRGALMFRGIGQLSKNYNIMPKSIKSIYHYDVFNAEE